MNIFPLRFLVPIATLAIVSCAATPALSQKKPAPKTPPKATQKPASKRVTAPNQTKGQGQLMGIDGQFGTIYTLQNGFNFQIVSARYTPEPFRSYGALNVEAGYKMLVLEIAMKNTRDADNDFGGDGFFTFVDSTGELHADYQWSLQSKPTDSFFLNLRPGQGLGQPGSGDKIFIGVRLPQKARIVKVMINQGRLGKPDEKVFRFYVAGATKAEAGEPGDPKNAIEPLPENIRDPSDKSGAITLSEGIGTVGAFHPSGFFGLRLNSISFTEEKIADTEPGENKRYAILNITAKFLGKGEYGFYELTGGDQPNYWVEDTDGEKYVATKFLKPKADELPDRAFQFGDEYTFRVAIPVPKTVDAKRLIIGAGVGNRWAFPGSVLK